VRLGGLHRRLLCLENTAPPLLPCSKLEAEGAMQHPWARVAHAAALAASGGADAAAAVLAVALQAFHVADKSEVHRTALA
jgi:hypothetical protein